MMVSVQNCNNYTTKLPQSFFPPHYITVFPDVTIFRTVSRPA
jgi:hypothetical protein